MTNYKIIIPYRNRAEHLQEWVGVDNVLIVEQAKGKPFNRGKLLNIGFLECDADYLIFNDVDLIPITFKIMEGITQLAKSSIQKVDYLGGSTMFDSKTFEQIGGYHNDFWGRAEDNEMMANIKRLELPVRKYIMPFKELPHARPAVEFDADLWEMAQLPRIVQDQLSICTYKVISRIENRIVVEI